jgi:MEMO1 family protein
MSQIKLRDDLDIDLIQEFENKFIYISDPLLIAEPIALPFSYYPLIQTLMEGKKTPEEIAKDGAAKLLNLSDDRLYTLLDNLVTLNMIDTPTTRMAIESMQRYVDGNVRNSYCQSFSYPEDPKELTAFLDIILDKGKQLTEKPIKAILAPHIDLRLEESWETYANSFLALNNVEDVDTVIMLGTGHYRSTADFMFSKKDFKTPLGTANIDHELIAEIEKNTDIVLDDIAHYKEHSLEFHLLFLQRILGDKSFKIVPILTGSPAHYFNENTIPESNEKYKNTIDAIKNAIISSGKKVLILSSGDLSHVGRKFGDEFPAVTEQIRVKHEDESLIEMITKADKNAFFTEVTDAGDKNKICGTAPFYAALSLVDSKEVMAAGYNQWQEEETESMVSFAGFVVG